MTVDSLIEGWSTQTAVAAAGRHVLAIHDTSEINFHTSPAHRRGLGEIARGNSYGVLLHAMLAVDAQSGDSLGLVVCSGSASEVAQKRRWCSPRKR